ncbi:sensor histidine kinase regulating citrate/malate metabolism [Salinibacterium sp. CAN_S4]|uniref:sensor histidine kinase n=1 Tax=Salinibacterium sp. CAN_S4 TaxID=2787727 RepID=UPI0018EFAA90
MQSRTWSVAGRVFGVQVLAVLVIGAILLLVLAFDARRSVDDDAALTSLAVSRTIATDPAVTEALAADDPSSLLQPYALATIASARVDFVTIMDPEGTRFTHPDASQIGKTFLGTITDARAGRTITETYTGTLGPSVRAVVPVIVDGKVVGIVSAGVTTANVVSAMIPRIPFVIGIAMVVVIVGALAAAITRRSLRRVTGDMAPAQMGRMVQFYESVLHSVREGVVITDPQRRVVLYNDEAADLLGIQPAPRTAAPTIAENLGIDQDVATLLGSGRRVVEETHVAGGRVLLVNQEPAASPSGGESTPVGAVMTLRDQSELQSLVGELESVRTMSEALRSQAHEHANTLHTIVSLLEMGRAEEVATLVADTTRTSQGLADAVLDSDVDPVLAALLLGKSATASERGVDFTIRLEHGTELPLGSSETISVVGNLIDNALDAVRGTAKPRSVAVHLRRDGGGVILSVVDSGQGVVVDDVFALGTTTKAPDGSAHGVGLAVVRRIVVEHGGIVEFADGLPTTVMVTLPVGALE